MIRSRAIAKAMKHQLVSLKHDEANTEVFDMSDPGTGKTFVRIMAFARDRKRGGGCMLVLAPRSLLRAAWANDFAKFAPHLKVSVAMANNREEAFAADADVYITNHDAAKWLVKQKPAFWAKFKNGHVAADECFPAGTCVDTPQGPRAIETLAIGDIVTTSDGDLPVTNTFVSESDLLVRLEFDDGTHFHCTPNHPIATSEGWREARSTCGMLAVRLHVHSYPQPGAALLRPRMQQEGELEQLDSPGKRSPDAEDCECAQGAHDLEQRSALQAAHSAAAELGPQSVGAPAKNTGRQRACVADRSAGLGDVASDLGRAAPDQDTSTEGQRVSASVQGGFCKPSAQESAGDRRGFTLVAQTLGCQEGRFADFSRVVRVSDIEPRGTVPVYNLQVDGPQNYSVENTLVHNCTAYKHHTSQRSKAALKVFQPKVQVFKKRVVMTATPTSNGICDIWHQVALLDNGQRLGGSFYGFRNSVCTPQQMSRFNPHAIKWHDKDGAEEAVFGLLSDVVIRHRIEDCVDIPPTHIYSVEYELTPKQRKAYNDMSEAQILMLGKKNGPSLNAVNAAAVQTKLCQIASGAVYDNDGKPHVIDSSRYESVIDMCEVRKHPIVFFFWKHQRDALVAEATSRGLTYAVLDGDASDKERAAIEVKYQLGHFDILFGHPKTVAHGFTFTAGTSTIWTSPTPDLEWWKQGNRRQARIGQKHKTEIVVCLATDTLEERIYNEILMPKDGRMCSLLDLFVTR